MFIFNTATTANGFLADPNNSLEWLFQVKSEAPDMEPFTQTVSVFVMGSSTYEWLLNTENMLEHPEKWTGFFGDRPSYVFTSRDLPVPPGVDVRFLNSSVPDALPTITETAGEGVVWVMGGGDLVGQFLDAGALDHIIMTLAPAFLASGKPLLPRTVYPDRLTLKGARTVGQFVEITYDVVNPSPSA